MGSQCSSWSSEPVESYHLATVTSPAAAFCTHCSLLIVLEYIAVIQPSSMVNCWRSPQGKETQIEAPTWSQEYSGWHRFKHPYVRPQSTTWNRIHHRRPQPFPPSFRPSFLHSALPLPPVTSHYPPHVTPHLSLLCQQPGLICSDTRVAQFSLSALKLH